MPTRKDSKGRILRRGEGQRPNGQYYFKYKDAKGKTRFKYSWTLTAHDFPPKGKKADKCLREIEKQVQRDLFDRVAPEKMTVLQLVENYVSTKTAVRQTTKAGYKTVLNFLAKDEFGSRLIDAVTTLDAKSWLIYLQKKPREELQLYPLHQGRASSRLPACRGGRSHQAKPIQLRACLCACQ